MSKYKKYISLLFGNVFFGVDGINWTKNHQEHHYVPCMPGEDPQNDHLPFILYKKEELTITNRKINYFSKLLLKFQHIYMIILLFTFAKINIILDLDNREVLSDLLFNQKKETKIDLISRCMGIITHIIVWVMATKSKTSKFLFLSSALFMNGFIHLQIILSHAYMPRITHDTIDNIGWVRCQAITAVNIETKWYDDWFHGGLQYQFDHHIGFHRVAHKNKEHTGVCRSSHQ